MAAEQCLEKSRSYFEKTDLESALKCAEKSMRMFETSSAQGNHFYLAGEVCYSVCIVR